MPKAAGDNNVKLYFQDLSYQFIAGQENQD